MGSSGSGKGTQSELLREYFKEKGEEVLKIELGEEFRNFLKTENQTTNNLSKLIKNGHLAPTFLAVFLWSKKLNDNFDENKNLIIDGSPRTLQEAEMLEEALRFYGFEKINIIYIKVDKDVVKRRMFDRKRADDTEEKIENRLKWFEEMVLPTVDYFRDKELYNFIEVDGNQDIESVRAEILKKI